MRGLPPRAGPFGRHLARIAGSGRGVPATPCGMCAGCFVVGFANGRILLDVELPAIRTAAPPARPPRASSRSELRGKAEGEAGSARRGVAGEFAAVLLGDAPGNGEAEAVPGFVGLEPDEAFENALTLVFGYAGSVVGDERPDVSVPAS
jgi:hypothetical protein